MHTLVIYHEKDIKTQLCFVSYRRTELPHTFSLYFDGLGTDENCMHIWEDNIKMDISITGRWLYFLSSRFVIW
jgi:hypothetical protein